VNGVGPDSTHPFVIKNFRVWDSHWAITPASPGVLIDGIEISHSDYAFWRPRFDRHAYRGVVFFRSRWPFGATTGERPEEKDFPSPLSPVDDRPPVTVMTQIRPAGAGRVVVRGVTVDNANVRSVQVNDQNARPLAPDFLEWEAVLEGLRSGPITLAARAWDSAGNVERTPHQVRLTLP
jgi:hypothetical protein